MLRVKVWDIAGGNDSKIVATVESLQMTGTDLRSDEDHTLLYYNEITSAWVVYDDGTEWYDFTVEEVN